MLANTKAVLARTVRSLLALIAPCVLLSACGAEECTVSTVDIVFTPNGVAPGLYQADVATDRCGGDGTEGWRLEVDCVGDCPAFTARVFQERSLVAEEPAVSVARQAVIERYDSMSGDVNEYRLYIETDESASVAYQFVGRFTGAQAMVLGE